MRGRCYRGCHTLSYPRLEEAGFGRRSGDCFGKGFPGGKGSPSPGCRPHTFQSETKGHSEARGTGAQLAGARFVLHSHFVSTAGKWASPWRLPSKIASLCLIPWKVRGGFPYSTRVCTHSTHTQTHAHTHHIPHPIRWGQE